MSIWSIYLSVFSFVVSVCLSVRLWYLVGYINHGRGRGPTVRCPPPSPSRGGGRAETTHTHSSPLCFISTLLIHIFLFLLSLVFVRKPEKRDKNFKLVFKSTIRKKATKNMASLWVHRKVIVRFFYGLALLALRAFLCCEKFLRICFK